MGAGFAGIAAAIVLRRAGFEEVTVLEAAEEVGGTWRDNTYPGCACDIPSHLYSLSFDLRPGWSRAYPGQAEIEDYLCDVVDRHGLRDLIRFGVTVAEMRWDEAEATWTVTTVDGEVLTADVVINGTGPLRARIARTSPDSTTSAAPCSIPRAGTTTTTSPVSGWR